MAMMKKIGNIKSKMMNVVEQKIGNKKSKVMDALEKNLASGSYTKKYTDARTAGMLKEAGAKMKGMNRLKVR